LKSKQLTNDLIIAHDSIEELNNVNVEQKQHHQKTVIQLEEDNCITLRTVRLELENQLELVRDEYMLLQQTQYDTKVQLDSKSKYHNEYTIDTRKQLEQLQNECNDLQMNIKVSSDKEYELQKSLDDVNNILDVTSKKLIVITKEKDQIEIQFQNEQKKVIQLENNNIVLTKDVKDAVNAVEQLYAVFAIQQIRIVRGEREQRREQQQQQYEESVAAVVEENTILQLKVKELEKEYESLVNVLLNAKKERIELNDEISNSNKEHSVLQNAHHTLKEQLSRLMLELSESKILFEKNVNDLMVRQKEVEVDVDTSNRIRIDLEETLRETNISWELSKIALVKKEVENERLQFDIIDVTTKIKCLQKEQGVLVAEKDEAHIIHSKTIEQHHTSTIAFKEEIETTKKEFIDYKNQQEDIIQSQIERNDKNRIILEVQLENSMASLKETNFLLEQKEKEKCKILKQVHDLEEMHETLMVDHCRALEEKEFANHTGSEALLDNQIERLSESIQHIEQSKIDAIVITRAETIAEQQILIDAVEMKARVVQENNDILHAQQLDDIKNEAAIEKETILALHSRRLKETTVSTEVLQKQLNGTQKQLLVSEKQKQDLLIEIETLNRKQCILEEKCHQTSVLLQQITSRLDREENEKIDILSNISNLETMIESMKNDKSQANSKNQAIIASHAIMMANHQLLLKKKEDEAKESKDRIIVLQNEREHLIRAAALDKDTTSAVHSKKIKDVEISALVLQEKLEIAQKLELVSKKEKQELQVHIVSLDDELVSLKISFEEILDSLTKTKNELEHMKENESSLQTQLFNMHTKEDTMTLEQSNSVREMAEVVAAHSLELQHYQSATAEVESNTRVLQEEVLSLKKDNGAMKDAITKEKEETVSLHSTAVEELKASTLVLQEKLKEVETQSVESKRVEEDLKIRINELDAELFTVKSMFGKALEHLKDTGSRLERVEDYEQTLHTQISDLQKEETSLTLEKSKLTKHMQALESAHSRAVELNIVLLKETEAKAQAAYGQIEVLRRKQKDAESDFDAEKERNLFLHSKALNDHELSVLALKKQLEAVHEQVLGSKKEKYDMHKKIESLEADRLDLQTKYGYASDRLTDAEYQLELSEEEGSTLRSRISDLEAIVESMKNELSQAASKRDDIVASNAAVLHDRQLFLTNVESQAQAAQEQVNTLKILKEQSNDEHEELRSKYSLVLSSTEELKASLCNIEREKIELRVELSESRNSEDALRHKVLTIIEENKSLIASKATLTKEHSSVVERVESSRNDVINENNNLKSVLREMDQAKDSDLQLYTAAEKKNLDLQQKLENIVDRNSIRIDELDSERISLLKDIERMKNNQLLSEQEFDRYVVTSKGENSDLIGAADDANETMERMKSELERLLIQNNEYTQKLQSIEVERKRLQSEVDEAQQETMRVTVLQSVSDTAVQRLERDLSHEQNRAKSLQNENHILASSFQDLESKEREIVVDLQKANDAVENERNDHNVLEIKFEKMQAEFTDLELDAVTSQTQLKEKATQEEDLCAEILFLKQRTNELQKEKDEDSKTTAIAAESENKNLLVQLDNAAIVINNLQLCLERLKNEINDNANENKNAAAAVQVETENRIRYLERELERVLSENAREQKKTKNLAKFIKKTINCATRVSRMKVAVTLRFRDTISRENRQVRVHAEYSGPICNRKPDGAGIMRFACGDLYVGMFEKGKFH
jgi:chromosome segregation ATPase